MREHDLLQDLARILGTDWAWHPDHTPKLEKRILVSRLADKTMTRRLAFLSVLGEVWKWSKEINKRQALARPPNAEVRDDLRSILQTARKLNRLLEKSGHHADDAMGSKVRYNGPSWGDTLKGIAWLASLHKDRQLVEEIGILGGKGRANKPERIGLAYSPEDEVIVVAFWLARTYLWLDMPPSRGKPDNMSGYIHAGEGPFRDAAYCLWELCFGKVPGEDVRGRCNRVLDNYRKINSGQGNILKRPNDGHRGSLSLQDRTHYLPIIGHADYGIMARFYSNKILGIPRPVRK